MSIDAEPSPAPGARRRALQAPFTEAFGEASQLGFLGAADGAEQLDHALGFVEAVEARLGHGPGSVLDLGSGGGPPGLVLAACWPTTRTVLVEANHRRAEFLETWLDRLGRRGTAEVVTDRAEVLGHRSELRESFEFVTARSFGRPAVTAECGSAFLALGGRLMVSEPPDVGEDDPRWPIAGLALFGLARPQLQRAGGFGYRVIEKLVPLDDRYPRRTGIPAKRPMF